MKIKKCSFYLALIVLLSFFNFPVFAFLLVFNRINNQQNKPVTVIVKNTYPNTNSFTISVKAHESKTLPWATVWLADTNTSTALWYNGAGKLIIDDKAYSYGWTLSGSQTVFVTHFAKQKPVDSNIYFFQGKAWTHVDINPAGVPTLNSGG